MAVAPFTGAWIEIRIRMKSLTLYKRVAPFTGAWIEMISAASELCLSLVAPFTGAWIEIAKCASGSFRSRVAPFTGAWIEIAVSHITQRMATGRSLHGSVD